MENCVQLGGQHILDYQTKDDDLEIRLTHNTLVSFFHFWLHGVPLKQDHAVKPVRVEATDNIFDTLRVLEVEHKPLRPTEVESLLRGTFAWRDRRNVFSEGTYFLGWWINAEPQRPHGATNVAEWKRFWGQADAEVLQGSIRYGGGNLIAKLNTAPDQLTPDDFRLRPDSAGYRAGKDGKDLGADVDLVGPGPAYERWKKTPEYQQWLKESGQRK
jgi:hypothetical protein